MGSSHSIHSLHSLHFLVMLSHTLLNGLTVVPFSWTSTYKFKPQKGASSTLSNRSPWSQQRREGPRLDQRSYLDVGSSACYPFPPRQVLPNGAYQSQAQQSYGSMLLTSNDKVPAIGINVMPLSKDLKTHQRRKQDLVSLE